MQKRKTSFLIGLFLLLFLGFMAILALVVLFSQFGRIPFLRGGTVALLEIDGLISDTQEEMQRLRRYVENPTVRAIVLRIDSPGGSVGASQELYSEIRKLRTESRKPIVASMGNLAASGGYYIACAADEIYANPGTLTGSIGVILQLYDLQGVARKIGFDIDVVKSGRFKDTGSMFRDLTPAERELLDQMIADTYEQFLDAILATRRQDLATAFLKHGLISFPTTVTATTTATAVAPAAPALPTTAALAAIPGLYQRAEDVPEDVVRVYLRSFADGRLLTGRQAHELGLVDALGNARDAIHRAAQRAGMRGEPTVMRERESSSIMDLFEDRAQDTLSRLGLRQGPSLEYRVLLKH